MMRYLIGIDIGTTGTKTNVYREDGMLCGGAYRGYALAHERADWAEQDPEDWWRAVVATVREATAALPDRENIAALSLSTQGGSLVVLDAHGRPLIPAVSWMDRRAGRRELQALQAGKAADYHYTHTGWRLTNSFNLVQIKWLQNNRPDIFQSAAKFLSTSDYINYRLTGRFVTDVTSAGITNMEAIAHGAWDPQALADLSISEEQLSELLPSGEMLGYLTHEAAEALGIPSKTIVVNGGQDQYCGAVGACAIEPGDIMLATGTAWVVLGTFSKMLFDYESYIAPCPHILPGQYGAMATVPMGGMALEWFRDAFWNDGALPSFARIDSEVAQETSPGADGLLFYPHFSGATCPDWHAGNRAGFIGVHLGHRRPHFARAVMEGISFDVDRIIHALERSGGKTKRIKLVGGAARSDLWCGIVADVTGLPALRPAHGDAACTGAAIVAGVGACIYGGYEAAERVFCKLAQPIYPDAQRHETYQAIRKDYANGFKHLSAFYADRERR